MQVGAEKPNPTIFEAACRSLELPPELVVHVGDDRRQVCQSMHAACWVVLQLDQIRWYSAFCRNDMYGARDAGICAWMWSEDVRSWEQVEQRFIQHNAYDDLE